MSVDEQVSVLQEASAKASKSKESALEFLKGAGILTKEAERSTKSTAAGNKKK